MIEINRITIEFGKSFGCNSTRKPDVLETLAKDFQNGDWKIYVQDETVKVKGTVICPQCKEDTIHIQGSEWECGNCGATFLFNYGEYKDLE